ncbi:MOSC domain-containing protein [Asticcacaulis sp. 201]|uniref:MOSC domain-containing protein n=1 Tax=Asticcacaulis sp. 201 TaxID=3028787 RepID=UPI002916DBAB|nr:MOSC domain-containing protein [Asticcacaulis sp. 201]MDV6332274.1 MOSC domain-containing protein [Asticcacaulis sp. 201]
MLNPKSALADLLNATMRPGTVEWIGLRPIRRGDITVVDHADLDIQAGLVGDHYNNPRKGTRHVTLIQREDLFAISSYLDQAVTPAQLRRNIMVSGINLLALKDKVFQLGDAVLEMTGECHPCSRMEETFGTGGYNAVRHHGGITARVVANGRVRIGDRLTVA